MHLSWTVNRPCPSQVIGKELLKTRSWSPKRQNGWLEATSFLFPDSPNIWTLAFLTLVSEACLTIRKQAQARRRPGERDEAVSGQAVAHPGCGPPGMLPSLASLALFPSTHRLYMEDRWEALLSLSGHSLPPFSSPISFLPKTNNFPCL